MQIVAGVDTHKKSHAIAILNRLGELLDSFEIEANAKGFAHAMERASKHGGIIWGLEGTGSYGRVFARTLVREGQIVYEVPGTLTKRHRRQMSGSGKSDQRDAKAIAEAVLRERDNLHRFLDQDAEEATRILYARRNRLVSERTVKVNRIRALAVQLLLDLPSDLTTKGSMLELTETLRSTQTDGFADFEALDEMRDLFTDLERLQLKISEVEERMRPFVERLAATLLSVRGCGIVSAAGIIGYVGAIENYSNSSAFAAHAGASPVQCSSGKYSAVRVNTGGNRQLNRCLHNIANVQMRTQTHEGGIYYARKRAEGKTHREAMRCLKRRLASVVFRHLHAAAAASQTEVQKFAA